MNQIELIQEEIDKISIKDIEELHISQYDRHYEPFELYIIAVRKAILEPDSGHEGFDIAQAAARLTAYRFLSEIKKLMPDMYEHFREMASNEMPIA